MPARRRFPLASTLFLLFTVFTLVELAIIFWLASVTSWPFTILVAIVSAVVGSIMAKRAGLSVIARAKAELAQGQFPAKPLADGVMILIGGAFLITPGLITDLIGFSTLIPVCRRFYARLLIGWAKRNFKFMSIGAPSPGGIFGAGAPGMRGNGGGKSVFDAEPGSYHSDRDDAPPPKDGAVDVDFKRVE